jgi:DNA-binding NtrC family response regulator
VLEEAILTYTFLLIADAADSIWNDILEKALAPLGSLDVFPESEYLQLPQPKQYDLMIVDAAGAKDVVALVAGLHAQQGHTPIVVVTTSPTWRRAKEVFLAGAIDYIRKSMDPDSLRETFQTILAKSH